MDTAPIIIRKKKSGGGGGGHHGGAWKVAYADFVTAMMAFFLLMWLLNATSEEQRKGLADYFDPSIPLSRNSAGGSGMMGGEDMLTPPETAMNEKEGDRDPRTRHKQPDPSDETSAEGDDVESPRHRSKEATSEDDDPKASTEKAVKPADRGETGDAEAVGNAAAAARAAEAEKAALEAIQRQIEAELTTLGQEGLTRHFSLKVTPDGLVIEIGDLTSEPLFASGAARARPVLGTLIGVITPILNLTTNDIAVVGHTDAAPFNRPGYSNWELSADRANAARRMLAEAGLDPGRISRVSGRADTAPISGDPRDARNRRIAVTLLRKRAAPNDGG